MSLDHAIEIALANPIRGIPRMGATIYRRKKLISIGMNQLKTHPLAKKFQNKRSWSKNDFCCIHAEIAALVNARESVKGATLYVARIYPNGQTGLAKPCKGCQRAIIAYDLRDVQWTE